MRILRLKKREKASEMKKKNFQQQVNGKDIFDGKAKIEQIISILLERREVVTRSEVNTRIPKSTNKMKSEKK